MYEHLCLCVRLFLCMVMPDVVLHYVVSCGLDSPHDDDDKVQHVPAVADVGVLVHDQTIGNDLQEGLYCEDDEEGILHCFLHTHRERRHSGHFDQVWFS